MAYIPLRKAVEFLGLHPHREESTQMKARSKASKTRQDKDFTMLSPTSTVQPELPLFATAELVHKNSEMTWFDKLNVSSSNIQELKSSKILAHDSTSKGKDCKPYRSDLCAAISSRLLLPVETDCADSDLNYSSLWQNKTVDKSWFLTELFTDLKGVRGIFLRALVNTPWLRQHLNLFVC